MRLRRLDALENPPVALEVRHRRLLNMDPDREGHGCYAAVVRRWAAEIERAARLRLGEKLGGGLFGCAYLTSLPGVVAKVTGDPSEAANLAYAKKRQDARDDESAQPFRRGFCRVGGVWKFDLSAAEEKLLPRALTEAWEHEDTGAGAPPDRLGIYLIAREEVDPLPSSARRELSEEFQLFVDAALLGVDYLAAARAPLARREKLGPIAARVRSRLIAVSPPLDRVAAGVLAFFEETGTVITDVHSGNVGRRAQRGMVDGEPRSSDGVGDLVLFDPGFTQSTADIHIRKLRRSETIERAARKR